MVHKSHYRRKCATTLIILFMAAFFTWGLSPVPSARAATGTLIWPMSGQVTSPCGERASTNSFHQGLDIAAYHVNVIAAYGGIAYQKYDSGGYGNYLDIDHGNGYVTRYGHLLKFLVPNGASVTQGEVVAISGGAPDDPGKGDAQGAHLHFEIRLNNVAQCSINNAASVGTPVVQGQPMNVDVNLNPSPLGASTLIANVNACGALFIKQGYWGTWQQHTGCGQTKSVSISPDGQTIVTVSSNNTLFAKQGLWGTWTEHTSVGDSQAAAAGPNGMIANVNACGALFIKLSFWGTWQQHTGCGGAKAVSISPDGQIIGIVRPDNTLFAKQGLWGIWAEHTSVGDSQAVTVV